MDSQEVRPAVLTVAQLQEYLNLGANATYALVKSPWFPTLRLGKKIRVPVEALERWIAAQVAK